jgi:hypothetical protein
LAKIRLMWLLTVWALRYSSEAMPGLAIPRAIIERISASLRVSPSGRSSKNSRGAPRPEAPRDVGPVGVLGEVAAGAGLQGGEDRRVVGIGREHHDRHSGVLCGQPSGGLGPVQEGHVQVEKDRVRVLVRDELERFFAVGCRADNLDIGEQAEEQHKAFADAGLVVGHDDPQRCPGAG